MLTAILRVLRDIAALVRTPVYRVGMVVPGIGTGLAYASGDAFGGKLVFHVPSEGTISNVTFLDYDDEGIVKELVLFDRDFTATADNAAMDVSVRNSLGVVPINEFFDLGGDRIGQGTPALGYVVPDGMLYGQLVTRGADNIAAGAIPEIWLVIV